MAKSIILWLNPIWAKLLYSSLLNTKNLTLFVGKGMVSEQKNETQTSKVRRGMSRRTAKKKKHSACQQMENGNLSGQLQGHWCYLRWMTWQDIQKAHYTCRLSCQVTVCQLQEMKSKYTPLAAWTLGLQLQYFHWQQPESSGYRFVLQIKIWQNTIALAKHSETFYTWMQYKLNPMDQELSVKR